MLYFFNTVCCFLILWSLIFILVQQEIIHVIFSLVIFISSSLSWIGLRQLEFIVLILFIIYVGVIVVLFLFITIIYQLPKLIFNFSELMIWIIAVGFLFSVTYVEKVQVVRVFSGVDILYLSNFFNNYPITILLCGALLLMSIISALIIVNVLYVTHYK
jgi:NADH:ubiquinone oxidoreductase subunit 6 (subunit J)